MKNAIYKYTLNSGKEISASNEIELPFGAKILRIKNQYEKPVLYALINTDIKRTEIRTIQSFATGLNGYYDYEKMDYIDTVLFDGGDFVAHFFERVN